MKSYRIKVVMNVACFGSPCWPRTFLFLTLHLNHSNRKEPFSEHLPSPRDMALQWQLPHTCLLGRLASSFQMGEPRRKENKWFS